MCNEIVPRDVLHLGNKTCITFSGDQLTVVMHIQIGPEFMSKFNCHDKSTSHITQCCDPGQTRILKDSVEQLV